MRDSLQIPLLIKTKTLMYLVHKGERILRFVRQSGFNWKLIREIHCFKKADKDQNGGSMTKP